MKIGAGSPEEIHRVFTVVIGVSTDEWIDALETGADNIYTCNTESARSGPERLLKVARINRRSA